MFPITMWRYMVRCAAAMLAFTLALGIPADGGRAAETEADSKPNVVLVLDSSRSMWGQIEGVNKVVSARTVIADMAKSSGGKLNLGLVAYGHRKSSGCDDIETLLPLGQHEPDAVEKSVKSIKPKGSTPLADALRHAADAAGYKERKAALVLVSDGLDNCDRDPCAAAAELEKQGLDLTVHAIAFDRHRKEKLVALSCVAEKTGGSFTSATTEDELRTGLTDAVETIIASARSNKPEQEQLPSTPAETAAATPIPENEAAPRTDPLTTGSLAQPDSAGNTGAEQPAASGREEAPKADKGEQKTAARSREPVPVRLSARTVEGGTTITSGLVWWVYKPDADKDEKYELVETFREPKPTAALKPGRYRVAAAYGKVHLIKDITVESGNALQEDFVLNAGGLRLNAVTANGTPIPPNSVRYDIYTDEAQADQFGNRKLALRDAEPGLVLRLNSGVYQIVSTYGDANAIVRAEVTVEPGKLTEAAIHHNAAKVTFRLVRKPGGEALAGTQWNILTPGGDIVKESAGALPTHILAAGEYSVLARHNGKNFTRDFAIKPGETKQVEVVIR